MQDFHPPQWQPLALTRPFVEMHAPGLPVHLDVKAFSVLHVWESEAAAAEMVARDRKDYATEKYMKFLRSSLAVMADDIAHKNPHFVLALASNTGDIKAIATVTTSPGRSLQSGKLRQLIVSPKVKQRRTVQDIFLNQLDDLLGKWMGAAGDELKATGFDQVIEDDMEDIFEDAREEMQKKAYETLADRTFRTAAGSRRVTGPTAQPGGLLDAQMLFRVVTLEM